MLHASLPIPPTAMTRRTLPRWTLAAALALIAPVAPAADTPDQPLKALPYSPGLDLANLDRSADACTDFYRFACGGWQQKNPIPADQASWDV